MDEDKRPVIVAAIPAYNEEKTIGKVVLLAQKHVDRVLVCDDGSTDWTAEIAEKLGADVVRHDKNCGYGAALQSLLRRAKELDADIMVTLDGDGQHEPAEIPALIRPVLEGFADVSIGSRFIKITHVNDIPLYRRVGIEAITKLTRAACSNYAISDAQSGFRAYNRKAMESLMLHENGMGASVEILLDAKKQGLRMAEVPVPCNYKGLKTSTHKPLSHGISIIMSIIKLVVEERPLIFLGLPGTISIVVGLMFGAWTLQLYTTARYVVTNLALASIAFILLGFFMVSTAITLYAIMRLAQKIRRQ